MIKTCSKCKIDKPIKMFTCNKARPDGREYWCKTCRNVMDRKRDLTSKRIEKSKKYHTSDSGRVIINAARRRDYKLNKHKYTAKQEVAIAIKGGIINRKPCEVCREYPSFAHHPDYAKPLDVVWRCQKHHAEEHRALRS